MAILFPRDLARLTAECAERFAERPTYAYVVLDILDHLEHDIFADEQGVPQTTAIAVNRGLAAAFDAVLAAHDPDAVHTATDALVPAWWTLRPRI